MVFWVTTFVVVFELAAGSVWNLVPLEWVEIQLRHLGYPHFLTYILGGWQAAAAVAIVVPRFPLIKEWAYAGALLLWSGAAVSHLAIGDGVSSWGPPLMFGVFATASWMLRPADRRLAGTRLRRYRPADARQDGAERPETRPRAWAVSIGLLAALYAVSFLTLPAAEAVMHEQAVERGWIHE
ncbi:DoxX family protein [Actinoplanes sp. ATCC 53533]|uniref:DoxX family protein n=1 Tax=Actinoplanes sp. ATCC 53533 TaxID=1288362 RepID=UPI0018F73CA3|nr:DoxX family protein [Actinoplanes sp. ATCC 53533]